MSNSETGTPPDGLIACLEPGDFAGEECLVFTDKRLFVVFTSSQCTYCVRARPAFRRLAERPPHGTVLAEAHSDDFPSWPLTLTGVPHYAIYENGRRLAAGQPDDRSEAGLRAYLRTV